MVSVGKSLKKLKNKLSKGHSNPSEPSSESPRSLPATPSAATPTRITEPSTSLPRKPSQAASSTASTTAPTNGGIKGAVTSKTVSGIDSATTNPVEPEKSPGTVAAPAPPTSPARITITLKHIAAAWVAVCGLIFLAFLAWERPPWWEYVLALVLTLPVGFAYAYLYHRNQVRKAESSYLLRINPGIKGLNYLLGSVPTWISFKEKEKADVFNSIIQEMWPYIDKAVASSVKASVEPILEQFKPPFISRIYFKDFTFGGAPIELDNVWVDPNSTDKIVLEVDIRWSAETANIALAVDMLGSSDLTRLVVRVCDVALSGTARVTFQPLVDEYPGFGAMTVALMGIPVLRYRPNFGKLGGSFSAKAVQIWLDGVIRQQLMGMLIWPQRLVIPMFDEKITGPLDKLYLRNVGALKVEVIKGLGLTKMDTFSESDPFVVAYTNPKHHERTKIVRNSCNPVWNEELWFLIQEPDTQYLYLECFDHDDLNYKEMLKLNFIRNVGSVGADELIGRCKVPLKSICAKAGDRELVKAALGTEEYSNFEGCGHGAGYVELYITYFPLGSVNPATASKGGLLVNVVRANNLLPESEDDLPDAYLKISVKGHKDVLRTTPVIDNMDPVWPAGSNKFEVSPVLRTDTVVVHLMDSDVYSRDSHVGTVEVRVEDLGHELVEGTWELVLEKEGKKRLKYSRTEAAPTVTLQMQWIPFA